MEKRRAEKCKAKNKASLSDERFPHRRGAENAEVSQREEEIKREFLYYISPPLFYSSSSLCETSAFSAPLR